MCWSEWREEAGTTSTRQPEPEPAERGEGPSGQQSRSQQHHVTRPSHSATPASVIRQEERGDVTNRCIAIIVSSYEKCKSAACYVLSDSLLAES